MKLTAVLAGGLLAAGTCQADLLATASYQLDVAAGSSTRQIGLGYDTTFGGDLEIGLFDELAFSTIHSGDTFSVASDADDAQWSAFVGMITDGNDDFLSFRIHALGADSNTAGSLESAGLVGNPGVGPDLTGYILDEVLMTIDSIGTTFVDASFEIHGRVIPAPPAAAGLMLGLALFGRRSPVGWMFPHHNAVAALQFAHAAV